MVILTMTIERMCIMWDERSPFAAIKASFGSLFAATLCYWAMNQPQIQYLVFAFPELILVILYFIYMTIIMVRQTQIFFGSKQQLTTHQVLQILVIICLPELILQG
jgi:hypothetical protein